MPKPPPLAVLRPIVAALRALPSWAVVAAVLLAAQGATADTATYFGNPGQVRGCARAGEGAPSHAHPPSIWRLQERPCPLRRAFGRRAMRTAPAVSRPGIAASCSADGVSREGGVVAA